MPSPVSQQSGLISQEAVDNQLSSYKLNIRETMGLLPVISSRDCRKVDQENLERLAEERVVIGISLQAILRFSFLV